MGFRGNSQQIFQQTSNDKNSNKLKILKSISLNYLFIVLELKMDSDNQQ